MSEPEIARRCSACGASIRERAFFCPQCGNSVGDKTQPLEAAQTIAEPAPEVPENASSELGQTIDLDPHIQPQPRELQQTIAEPVVPRNAETTGLNRGDYATRRLHRVAAGAKEAFTEDVRPRVNQIKKISSVVIDQAAYDPSLRFVLVALFFFLVFLTILVMSKLIG